MQHPCLEDDAHGPPHLGEHEGHHADEGHDAHERHQVVPEEGGPAVEEAVGTQGVDGLGGEHGGQHHARGAAQAVAGPHVERVVHVRLLVEHVGHLDTRRRRRQHRRVRCCEGAEGGGGSEGHVVPGWRRRRR